MYEIIISIFIIFVPGFLIWNLLRPKIQYNWGDFVYSIGLGVAFIMLSGLALNSISLYLGYKAPLSLSPLLYLFILSTLFFLILNIILRRKLFKIKPAFKFKIINHKLLNILIFIIACILPVMSALGTSALNNNGSNMILVFNLGLLGAFILLILLLFEKINLSVIPISVYSIALSILFNISLRGWNINGTDVLTEYKMFQVTLNNSHWAMSSILHAYNACISITILPTIVQQITNMPSEYVFKLFMQIIFAFVPVIVYLFIKNFTNKIYAFLGALLYISFPIYVNSMSMHIRQEIAFLFFALLLLILFDKKIQSVSKNVLIIVFMVSMVISHYSTTYLAIALFMIWYLINLFFRIISLKFYSVSNIFKQSNLKLWHTLFLIIFSLFWYVYIVNIGNNISSFGLKVLNNLSKTLTADTRVDQTSIMNQFNIFYKQEDLQNLLSKYVKETNAKNKKNDGNFYKPTTYADYQPQIVPPPILNFNVDINTHTFIILLMEVVKKLQKFFIFFGVLYLTYIFCKSIVNKQSVKPSFFDKDYLLVATASLLIILAFTILPYFTIEYDIMRATQQLLNILVGPAIIGSSVFLIKPLKKYQFLFTSLFVVVYFFIYNGFINNLIGGVPPSFQLNNYGSGFDRLYIYDGEIQSAKWLEKNKKNNVLAHTDADSSTRIAMSTLKTISTTSTLLPSQIYKYSYVYLNNFNINQGITYTSYRGESMRFSIPVWFYNKNKNLIYSNNYSRVYF